MTADVLRALGSLQLHLVVKVILRLIAFVFLLVVFTVFFFDPLLVFILILLEYNWYFRLLFELVPPAEPITTLGDSSPSLLLIDEAMGA